MPCSVTITVKTGETVTGTAVSGRAVTTMPKYYPVNATQVDTGQKAHLSDQFPSTVTDGSGVATVSMPRLDELQYSGSIWYIVVEDLGVWSGSPPNTNSTTLYGLLTTYGWALETS